jgi:hypothetical protein
MGRAFAGGVIGALSFVAILAEAQETVTVNSVSGDANTFQSSFSMQWFSLANTGGNVSGSWAGGTWQFVFGYSRNGDPSHNEFLMFYTLRTFWNDGWIPGGLGSPMLTNGGQSFVSAPLPLVGGGSDPTVGPVLWTDWGPNGLSYYLTATGTATNGQFAIDGSGRVNMAFNMSRAAAVPEPGTVSFLLWLGLLLIATRTRGIIAAVRGDQRQ